MGKKAKEEIHPNMSMLKVRIPHWNLRCVLNLFAVVSNHSPEMLKQLLANRYGFSLRKIAVFCDGDFWQDMIGEFAK